MVTRITGQMLLNTAGYNLQSSKLSLARLQDQAGTQKLISRPSDNPAGTAESMRIRADQRALAQYGTNLDDGLAWLSMADSALTNATTVLQRARDLVVQGANSGALTPAAREAIATELESLRGSLLTTANTTYAGRAVFAGNSDAGRAFNPDLSYTGVVGSTVDRRVGPNTTVRVDVDGTAAFGTGATSAFALLDTIATELRAGTNVGARVGDIDTAMSSILGEQSRVGARYAQLETSKELNMDQFGSLESQRASVEDVDLSKVILELKTQEMAYQAALSVTARALQPTLLSFLS